MYSEFLDAKFKTAYHPISVPVYRRTEFLLSALLPQIRQIRDMEAVARVITSSRGLKQCRHALLNACISVCTRRQRP